MSGPRPKPPTGPPPSAGVLARYARAYAKELAVSEGRVRAWISYMMLAGLLEQAVTNNSVDGYQGFSFRRKGEPLVLENRTISVEFAVTYRGGTWTSIIVDVARAEPGEAQIELVPAVPLREAIGISGPSEMACLPLPMHIAQKFHGMTLPPRAGKRNERFKDLVDLLLMESLVTDYRRLREACQMVFQSRRTHVWPPVFEVPVHWVAPFAALARELDLPVHDAEEALERVRAFVQRIQNA